MDGEEALMAALPDFMLYPDEQHEEWVREEYEMPKYGKRDANHQDIKDAAQRMGATVIDTPG